MSERTNIADLIEGYTPGRFPRDEMLAVDGSIRPHWQGFLGSFSSLGSQARADMAQAQSERLLETGIAFNVQADPTDRRFSWRLDPLPVIVTSEEWQSLEKGLKQRATLIDRVLQDVYSERQTLHRQLLPPSLILGSSDYIHAAYGWPIQPRRRMLIYACDLARMADGSWQVLADQVDAPSGHGWLLASRVSQSNAMGDLFLSNGVRRVASYFSMMKGMFTEMVGDNGRIAVLSPGPENPGYFSHAYLARYLGLPIVEAADLSHRQGILHLKTLEGLMRVDLLISKIRSAALDSLSIPSTAGLGTPGITQTALNGRLLMANVIGAGVLQNRALANHSRLLCEHLLGEDLLLGESPCLWLGDDDAVERFLSEPGWQISPVGARNDPGEANRIDPLEGIHDPDAKRRFLKMYGYRWIAGKPVELPTAPRFEYDRLKPVHWALRAFVCLDEEGQYTVLPGGLVRQSPEPTALGLPNGYGSKDLWVLSGDDEKPVASIMQQRLRTVHLQRTGKDLLSRTAENLFWLGRYVERTETVLRILSSIFSRIIEDGGVENRERLLQSILKVHMTKLDPQGDLTSDIRRLINDPATVYSIHNSLNGIASNAALTRSVLSRDGFRVLQALHTDPRWKSWHTSLNYAPPNALINQNIQRLLAFAGTAVDNMTRNYAWRFLEMGRRLERAVQVSLLSRQLIAASGDQDAISALTVLLEVGDSTMTYRSRYVAMPLAAPAVDLLVLDETNPRSLAYQLVMLDELMAALPNDSPYRKPEHRRVLAMLTDLRMNNADELVEPADDEGDVLQVHRVANNVMTAMQEASNLIAQNHFVIADTPTTSYSLKRSASV